ncbi:MAG: hypothetical protein U0998_03100 [Moraxellaceae bacterium]|nr:hypothetical protein [Moraxellaceae bacterium]MDZ4386190.1 hypothetical protein [Moraxellaceae bacterium]
MKKILLSVSAALFAATTLVACGGGGGGGGGSSSSSLGGVAAIGAPVVGGTITAKCANGQTYTTVNPSNANGVWRISNVPASAPPCALKLTGGTAGGNPAPELYSYADSTTGDVNITPFTDLIVSLAAGDPTAWYDDFGQGDALEVDAATDDLFDALNDAGYDLSRITDFNPLTARFNPVAGDPYDDLLEALGAAVDGDYTELRALAADGELELPAAPVAPEEPTDPEAPSNIAVLTAFAGTYTVTGTAAGVESHGARGVATRDHERGTIMIAGNGNVDFDVGISLPANSIVALFDRRSLCDLDPQFDRAACRIHVNYGANDSGAKLELFLALDKTTVLEIRYQDGQGGITRAAIGAANEPEPGTGDGAALGGKDGATGTFDGVTYTFAKDDAAAIFPNTGWQALNPLVAVEQRRYQFDAFKSENGNVDVLTFWRLSGVPGSIGTHACGTEQGNTLPVVRLMVAGVLRDSTSCSITITEFDMPFGSAFGTVLGTFTAVIDGKTVSDGYFKATAVPPPSK